MKQRVLHIIANLSVGGAEVHLLALLRGLVASGEVEVGLAFYRERPDEARSLLEDFRAAGVRVYDLGLRRNPLTAWWRLRRVISDYQPDLVHTHLSRVTLGDAPLARLGGIRRIVISVHTNEWYFQHPVWRALLRQSGRAGTRYIAISEAVRSALQRYLGVPREKIDRVYYSLDLDSFAREARDVREELGLAPDELVIGTVGRMDVQKGQQYLIAAVPEIRARFPRSRLVIVGHDTGARAGLERQVRELGLEDAVMLVGYRSDVASMMSAMDVFVLPSLWEGFGLVLLEAMSLERPIIATTVDSIPEIIVPPESGILVPPRDTPALVEAICELLDDSAKARSLGLGGRRRAAQAFSVERMIRETLDVYAATDSG